MIRLSLIGVRPHNLVADGQVWRTPGGRDYLVVTAPFRVRGDELARVTIQDQRTDKRRTVRCADMRRRWKLVQRQAPRVTDMAVAA
jgi:hypothetical protein